MKMADQLGNNVVTRTLINAGDNVPDFPLPSLSAISGSACKLFSEFLT
ncbi:hypothetical protein [Serratia proteamaculans]|nr:hypothetical protein [Serratia proteamaculans]